MSNRPAEEHSLVTALPWRRLVIRTSLLFCCISCLFLIWLGLYYYRPAPSSPHPEVVVVIPKGASLATISAILGDAGVITDDIRFRIIGRLSGYGRRVQAGEFALATGQKPLAVLRALATSRALLHSLTIPEGYTAADIGELLGREGWCDSRSFANLVVDRKLIDSLGFSATDSLEGYLFPDTYWLPRDFHGAKPLILLLTGRFEEVWRELVQGEVSATTRKEVVIMASMIEKEAAAPEERPLIAGVFYNRLQLGMRLQSDPTVMYGRNAQSGPITRDDLRTVTPYNTYAIDGLPAGPICNPGRGALAAALHPTATEHLYFVAKNDGSHQFNTTLSEHNKAVQKYQRKKSAENGK